MGIVHPGVPKDLVLLLRNAFGVEDFIEAGTYLGATASWAAGVFPRVTTIEAAPALYNEARLRHQGHANLRFELGDSRQVFPRLLPELTAPSIFWLDSHYSGGDTFGAQDECPLLE